MYFCFVVVYYVCYVFSEFLRHHIILSFSVVLSIKRRILHVLGGGPASTLLMLPHVCHMCSKSAPSSYFECECVHACVNHGSLGVLVFSPSARDADEREKWIHALEGTILRHTLQLRVWNNTFLSVCVCLSERMLRKERKIKFLNLKWEERVVI